MQKPLVLLDESNKIYLFITYILLFALVVLSPRRLISLGSFDLSYGYIIMVLFLIFFFKYAVINEGQIFIIFLFFLLMSLQFFFSKVNKTEMIKTDIQIFMTYFVLLFNINVSEKFYHKVLKCFQVILILSCIYGIIQTVFRSFFNIPDLLSFFSIDYIKGYYNLRKIESGNLLQSLNINFIEYKMNSFFNEPSIFQQYLALGIIIEIELFKKAGRIILFAVFFILTLSGTGFIILAGYFAVTLIFSNKNKLNILKYLSIGSIFVILILIFFPGLSSFYLSRFKEFAVPETSGHIRFVAPAIITFFSLKTNPFLGIGGGSHDIVPELLHINYAHTYDLNSYTYILVSYGIIGLILFVLFILKPNLVKNKIENKLLVFYFLFLLTGMYFITFVPLIIIFLFAFKVQKNALKE